MNDAKPLPPSVTALVEFNRDRRPKGRRLKFKRMEADPFAFFRGTDHLYARAWPDLRPHDVGPDILVSGDLHLENFGAYRVGTRTASTSTTSTRSLIGPCTLDLVRCATSILLALEQWGLTPLQTTGTVIAFLKEYRDAVELGVTRGLSGDESLDDGSLAKVLGAEPPMTEVELLDQVTRTTKSGERRIRRDPEKRPPVGSQRAGLVREAVQRFGQEAGRGDEFQVIDVTKRLAGIGSLGLRRYTVLIRGGGSPDLNRLLDLKEARPASLASCTTHPQPDVGGNEALRIVAAQRQLQARPPTLLDAVAIDGAWYRLRETVPDENRASISSLSRSPASCTRRSAAPAASSAAPRSAAAASGERTAPTTSPAGGRGPRSTRSWPRPPASPNGSAANTMNSTRPTARDSSVRAVTPNAGRRGRARPLAGVVPAEGPPLLTVRLLRVLRPRQRDEPDSP